MAPTGKDLSHSDDRDPSSRCTVVSAPGKVLLAGGYLVLDPKYSGLVTATSSRFYTVIRTSSQSTQSSDIEPAETVKSSKTKITVRAGQFPREGSVWSFDLSVQGNSPESGSVEVRPRGGAKNKFVQNTLDCVLRYTLQWLSRELPQAASDELLRRTGAEGEGLDIVVLADNDFYSQRETLASLNLPACISSLPHLPPFSPLPRPIHETNKTGLGSSAALVTSLTAALLSHLGVVDLPSFFAFTSPKPERPSPSTYDSLGHIHSLAQYAHCLAQGKVGSGFDVSSAVYDTHLYRRFSPSILLPLMESPSRNSDSRGASLLEHLNPAKWDSEVESFRLPKGLRLVLADVDAGTDTPSFVGKVLDWRKREEGEALRIWTELDEANGRLREGLERLRQQEGERLYDKTLQEAAVMSVSELDRSNNDSIHASLVDISKALEDMRAQMRAMSEASSVPIEPIEQTKLLDRCSSCPGVIGGGVPGAGGYDAIFLLLIDHPSPLSQIDDIWQGWTEMSVCALSSRQSDGGLRREEVGDVKGLREALERL